MDANNWLVLAFFKIELWNFQDNLDLWFREASQNLSSFRQLFFIVSKGGPKEKCWKNNWQFFTLLASISEKVVPLYDKYNFTCYFINELKSQNQLFSLFLSKKLKPFSAIPNLFSAKSKQTQNVWFFDKILGKWFSIFSIDRDII